MFPIPKKIEERIKTQIRKYKIPLEEALKRDVNEADTVTLVQDILADLFGWDKYTDLTSEKAIKGAFCDIAIRFKDKIWIIIEAKAIGKELNDNHLKQAVHYAADAGADWFVLTNGVSWKICNMKFSKPVDFNLFAEFDFRNINLRSQSDMEMLFALSKEGAKKDAMSLLYEENKITNKYVISTLIQTDPVLNLLRKEIRKLNKKVKVELDVLKNTLVNEVLKREVVEGAQVQEAQKLIKKAQRAR